MLSYMNTRGTGSYSIDPSRVRVLGGVTYYDRATVCHPKILAKQTNKFREGPPQVYFPFGDAKLASTVEGKTAHSISVPWKTGNTYNMHYTWSEKTGTWISCSTTSGMRTSGISCQRMESAISSTGVLL